MTEISRRGFMVGLAAVPVAMATTITFTGASSWVKAGQWVCITGLDAQDYGIITNLVCSSTIEVEIEADDV